MPDTEPPVILLGVRHHSPACARLVRETIRAVRPAHVLIEGPADMNARLDELLLDHELPIAVFTHYRDGGRRHMSWAPMCSYSPEWIALTEGRAAGAAVRFIDLPAWHPAFADTENRYADAERRYARATDRLCREFAVDNIDALWDHMIEIDGNVDDLGIDTAGLAIDTASSTVDTDGSAIAERLAAYFDVIRGDEQADPGDVAREEYMARWVCAAVADVRAGGQDPAPVVVVAGGFHRPALARLVAAAFDDAAAQSSTPADLSAARGSDDVPAAMPWPEVPEFPADGVGGSYLAPFGFRRLDAFSGYQSGMPSPAYYQRLWEAGPEVAAEDIVRAVVTRLRARGRPVSTADLIGAWALITGLARLRGHPSPSRTDVLDGLASALIAEGLDHPLPWTGRGQLRAGTDPVVLEMVAALSGDAVGRLAPATPQPPLVHNVAAELSAHGIPEHGELTLDLTRSPRLEAARILHRLRVLGIPGYDRIRGPRAGAPPELTETWRIAPSDLRVPALIEAGSYGATCAEAAAVKLGDRFAPGCSAPAEVAEVLFDAALCGLSELTDDIVATIHALLESSGDTAGLGALLATMLGLWRHDRLFGAAGSAVLAALLDAAVLRLVWLLEGIRGGPAPADEGLLGAVIAVRDTALHAREHLTMPRSDLVGVFARCTSADRPPALRGAALGVVTALAPDRATDSALAVRSVAAPAVLGDFLAGLFALAREHLLDEHERGTPLIAVLDQLVGRFGDEEFLAALPALRLAFSWFPPRERAKVAERLLTLRGLSGSGAALLRTTAEPHLLARARAIEQCVDELLSRHALLGEVSDA